MHPVSVPRIVLDFDPPLEEAPQIPGDTADLVYFLSWAFSARYGGNHELSIASLVLRGEFGIDLRPLLTFADREVETEADAEMLDRAWQDAGPLAETCRKVVEALGGDEKRLVSVQEDYPGLRDNIAGLGNIAALAAKRGSRIRVTFELGDGP
jgi:hypothetical protein